MTLFIKFMAGFAALGLVVSVVFSLLGGNRIVSIVTTGLVCTVLSAALGAGAYKTLEMRVPEFLEFLAGFSSVETASASSYNAEFENEDSGPDPGMQDQAEGEARSDDSSAGDAKVFGDHILVNKIKIKNEPKLIAQAIKTMLARDEE